MIEVKVCASIICMIIKITFIFYNDIHHIGNTVRILQYKL